MELWAFNVVKGEQNGDEFLWDEWCVDPKTGEQIQGVWKSFKEKNGNTVVAEK